MIRDDQPGPARRGPQRPAGYLAQALAQAAAGWLADLITRREPLGRWADAYARQPDDIKTILTFPGE